MDLHSKVQAIVDLVAAVRSRHGDQRVRILDYWPQDAFIIGFERVESDDVLVSVSTKAKPSGLYDVTVDVPDREAANDPYLDSGSFCDCVIDGVLAVIRKYVV